MEKEKKPVYKRWWFFVGMLFIFMGCIITRKDMNISNDVSTSASLISNNIINEVSEIGMNEVEKITAESNTSQKVDKIMLKAKEDSKMITEDIKKEAMEFIRNNKSNFYKDNETMEKAIYYGYLLERAYEKNDKKYANLGMDVYQAVKYVYRGVEKIDDVATQENLKQIEKDLEKISEEIIPTAQNITSKETKMEDIAISIAQKNALLTAKDYLNYTAFSYKGLIEQLKYEGYSVQEATYGADNCKADWNEQAAKMAKQYMDYKSFSKSGLIEQLEYEGFTKEQAQYGVSSVGY